jgi:chromosome segregation ATPase
MAYQGRFVSLLSQVPYNVPIITDTGTTILTESNDNVIEPSNVGGSIRDALSFGKVVKREDIIKLYNDNIELANLAQKIKSQNKIYNNKIIEYQRQLTGEATQIRDLSATLKQVQERSQEQQKLIEELNTANRIRENQVNQNKSLITAFDADVQSKDQTISDLRQQIQRAENEIKRQTQLASTCLSQNTVNENKLLQNEEKLRSVTANCESKIQSVISTTRAEVENKNQEIKRLSSEYENKMREIVAKKDEELKNLKTGATQQINVLQQQLVSSNSEKQELKNQLDKLSAKCGICDEQNKTLFADINKQLNDEKQKNSDLIQQIQRLQLSQSSQFEQEKKKLVDEKANLTQQIQRLQLSQSSQFEQERKKLVDDYQNKVQELASYQKTCANQLSTSENRVIELQNEVGSLTNVNRELQSKINNFNNIGSEAYNKCANESKIKDQRITQLEQQLIPLCKQELEQAKKKIIDLEQQLLTQSQSQSPSQSVLKTPPPLSLSMMTQNSDQCKVQVDTALNKCNSTSLLQEDTIRQLKAENDQYRQLLLQCPAELQKAKEQILELQKQLTQSKTPKTPALFPLALPNEQCKDQEKTIEDLRENIQEDEKRCSMETQKLNDTIDNIYRLSYQTYIDFLDKKLEEIVETTQNATVSEEKRQRANVIKDNAFNQIKQRENIIGNELDLAINNKSFTLGDLSKVLYFLSYYFIQEIFTPYLAALK